MQNTSAEVLYNYWAGTETKRFPCLDIGKCIEYRLGSALSKQTGGDEGECIRHLAQRLDVVLAKDNSALFLNRLPVFPPSEVDGYE